MISKSCKQTKKESKKHPDFADTQVYFHNLSLCFKTMVLFWNQNHFNSERLPKLLVQ